jgi:hypothetical protein
VKKLLYLQAFYRGEKFSGFCRRVFPAFFCPCDEILASVASLEICEQPGE